MKQLLYTISKIWVLLFAVAFSAQIAAQSNLEIALPYFNGWEDASENSRWKLNNDEVFTASNRWYVSSKESYTGRHSLLISDLKRSPDTCAVYSNDRINIIAARSILLEPGTYEFSFAYRIGGNPQSDGLYVAWLDNREIVDASTAMVPVWALDQNSEPYKGVMFAGSPRWKTARFTIPQVDRKTKKLAFLWVNDNYGVDSVSVCIDDIQIVETSQSCGKIGGISHSVQNRAVSLSWNALPSGTTYEVWAYSDYANYSDTTIATTNSLTTAALPNGLYTFYIRAVCGANKSAWYSHDKVVVYDNGYIDYTDLSGKDVTCYIDKDGDRMPIHKNLVDCGEDSITSRHTLNVHPGETDPRTGGKLTKIPKDEFVSVRLGNWDDGFDFSGNVYKPGAEAIAYEMQLKAGDKTILLMKYAVVLQMQESAMGPHTPTNQARFRLEILDAKSDTLIDSCGFIDFYALEESASPALGWDKYDVENDGEPDVLYKNWTDLGVDLSRYAANGDRSIKVRLSTYDCETTDHYGYAYFTLNCTSAQLNGASCKPAKELTAPYGFDYRWYKAEDADITKEPICDEQVFSNFDADDYGDYVCYCVSKEKSECFFELKASLMPHLPKADTTTLWAPKNCQNYVRLTNKSYIAAGGKPTGALPRAFKWIYPKEVGTNESDTNTVDNIFDLPFPDEGGTADVKLIAYADEIDCENDTISFQVTALPIDTIRDTVSVSWCSADGPFVLSGKPYEKSGVYELARTKSFGTGCDSIAYLHLDIVDPVEMPLDTIICFGDTLCIGDQQYTATVENLYLKLPAADGEGCDTIVKGRLRVQQSAMTYTAESATGTKRHGSIVLYDTLPGTAWAIDGEAGAPLDNIAVGRHTLDVFEPLEGYPDRMCQTSVEFVIEAQCLQMHTAEVGDVCAGDSILALPLVIDSGIIASYTLTFDEQALAAGFANIDEGNGAEIDTAVIIPVPDGIRPGHYTVSASFTDSLCDPLVFDIPLTVLYPASVMAQKWNDVVAVHNESLNGGYTFSAYGWYRNGVLQPSTTPYLYLPGGETFLPGEEVRVSLTRADDNVTVLSCPLITEARPDGAQYPTLASGSVANAMSKVVFANVRDTYRAEIYDLNGRHISTSAVGSAAPYITAPANTGVYVVVLSSSAARHTFKIVVIP